jgi:hypothetical protein
MGEMELLKRMRGKQWLKVCSARAAGEVKADKGESELPMMARAWAEQKGVKQDGEDGKEQ